MKKLAFGALFAGLVACGGGGDKKDDIVLPDSNTDGGPGVCNPLTQTGCNAGEKCAWVELQENPSLGQIACVPDGTVDVGAACTVGAAGPTGYSDCKAGSECVAGTCKSICDHQGGAPMCDANHACGRYEGLFESGDVTVAGVCDPKCDPLKQELLVGTNKAACGSPDPAMPNGGCFTFNFVDFTCAPVGPSTLTLTDGMEARGPASGGAYVNGCAPGFAPLLASPTGNNTVVCAGLCAPLKTDSTMPDNAVGNPAAEAKLPTKAAPAVGDGVCVTGKKGSLPASQRQNCLHAWVLNDDNGMLTPSPYNDTLGFCYNYQDYTYDHDNNAGTAEEIQPSCHELLPKGMAIPPTDKHQLTADQWIGCYNSTDSAFQSGRAKVHPVAHDLRLGTPGEVKLLRHVIR